MIAFGAVTNPRWQNAEHTKILCDVVFPRLGADPVPFCADQNDIEDHGRAIFAQIVAGNYGSIAAYVAPPEPPAPVPASISRRQFYQQLAAESTITQDEALAALDGAIPALLLGLIAQLAEADRFAAKMHLKGSATFERAHALTNAIGAAQGKSSGDIDAFFQAAAAL
jgi:hypothetical protein